MSTTTTDAVHSRARALILSVNRGHVTTEVPRLMELARHDPRFVAELACEVAFLAGEQGPIAWLVGQRAPADEEVRGGVLRMAHAAYERKVRTAWVIWGERLYQRDRGRRRRRAAEAAA